jgi:hypothetical protein
MKKFFLATSAAAALPTAGTADMAKPAYTAAAPPLPIPLSIRRARVS